MKKMAYLNLRRLTPVSSLALLLLVSGFTTGQVGDGPLALLPMKAHAPLTVDEDGQKIYETRCMSCHQINGQGITGVFPPLIESEWVVGDKGRLIRIVLGGISGEVEVNGVTYSGAMPPWNTFLNDAQIAALLTYIRSTWGNDADAITHDEVARVRAATADRKETWTAAELKQWGNFGIPKE